ncbi:MAG: hypothetical protein CL607_21575 [Anaerolineaceae bacterium]|nr:hypothetical protein [Anaerolineaceae bacterium]
MNITDFHSLYQLLTAAALDDPVLRLAYTVTWLDPLRVEQEGTLEDYDMAEDYYDGQGNDLEAALHITRDCFPDLYVEAVDNLRDGQSEEQVEEQIREGISEAGIPMEIAEFEGAYAFGIPLPAYGAEPENPEFYATHPDVMPILVCFGVSPTTDGYHIDIPDEVYTAGRYIAHHLAEHPDDRYRQISWLMQWLFACSGNSIVDFNYEVMCEMQPLPWEKDDVEFAIAMIAEADEIMVDVFAGLEMLASQPDLLKALQFNIHRTCSTIHLK